MDTRDKAIRIAEREGLCSVSSNTKWQELLPRLAEIPCKKRIKFIDSDEPTAWKRGMWQPHTNHIEASCGPEELKFVEWIEIRSVEKQKQGAMLPDKEIDHSDSIRQLLDAQGAVFKQTGESFVIFGYTRPGRP
ncbi:MAG: hypothetical protein EOP83_28250 [Verrucomicrobiaceae bacterium]|nr:MAG: hypothetical protein EOP83_28250 [Verrucomicrobiaceae bacterium]